MEGSSEPGKPQPEQPQPGLPRLMPPGLEMARGVIYFGLVLLVFQFLQLLAMVGNVLAHHPELLANGWSLNLLDTPIFQSHWNELAFNGDALALATLMADSAALALLFWLVYRWKRDRTGLFLATKLPTRRAALVWGGLFLVVFAALEGISHLLPDKDSEFMRKVLASATNTPLLIVGLCLMPALFEEFLLRGLLYGACRHLLNKHASVAIVAGVFTLMHPQYEWYLLLLYVLPLSVFLGYARANTGSIWLGVLLHLLNNVASLFLGSST